MGNVRALLTSLEGSLIQLARSDPTKQPPGVRRDYQQQRSQLALRECSRILETLGSVDALKGHAEDVRSSLEKGLYDNALETVQAMKEVAPAEAKIASTVVPKELTNLPAEITREVNADLAEAHKCFENTCYRSAIILCGRMLECALHRKYYDVTGNDLLETSPGFGLGKLVARLKESQVSLPVGLAEQIHLINHVRISSVHKKSELFLPSKQQTQAILLFTVDVIQHVFSSR